MKARGDDPNHAVHSLIAQLAPVAVLDAAAPPYGGHGDAGDGQREDEADDQKDIPVTASPVPCGGHVLPPRTLVVGGH